MSSRRRTSSSLAGPASVGLSFHRDGPAAAVEPLQRPLDVAGGHHPALDRPAQQIAQGGRGLRIEGVGNGHQQALAPVGDRNDAVALEERQLQAIRQQRHLRQLAGVHQRQAEEVGKQAGEIRLGDQPEPGQHEIEALARLPLRPERPLHRQVVEHAAPRKKVSEPLDEVLIARVGAPARQRGILIDHRSCDGDSNAW